ncbi:Piso0_001937 [Millerozyma farinosa CBS 7064]|uniref:Piso0_001937 protein n=1 Tax=Pichia sorbitophila (strain ATCC MYA-4447 / BCRC 22081 / CBS 7064 / NBRC 10061 / NRRL Y-12695) TaxID=559304 RepID=G8YB93_PICSO|nr:Piso0_001937 [Millerozyma farinosa CBS 7064]
MQYVGKVGGYVYNQWNALNPATLSGAIDIIVIERPDGTLHCSPWHVRFGKFQIIKPSQKKIDLYVNDIKTDLPMKLGEGGEAFFVFETSNPDMVSSSVVTSPVISATNSREPSPLSSPNSSPANSAAGMSIKDPDPLELTSQAKDSDGKGADDDTIEEKIKLTDSLDTPNKSPPRSPGSMSSKLAFERARRVTQKLNIPSKIDINGDIVLDIDGYKPNAQKNIDVSDEYFKKIFLKEINDLTSANDQVEVDESEYNFLDQIIRKDKDGNIRILNKADVDDEASANSNDINSDGLSRVTSLDDNSSNFDSNAYSQNDKTYFKTLRLTSEQLKKMNLHYGKNRLTFKVNEGTSQVVSNLYLWSYTTPIVISDIDGTITKSDALGHVLNLIGKDWTHPGVANLFQDISSNGYNIVYLTARSVGQADSTRQYLAGICQDGVNLPSGPVILSPDRTMAALKREVILKKPEVFKMSCLNDIKGLFFNSEGVNEDDRERTPFYAGFGNRITDAISYRSVHIPSHRIFTINPNGEVHMELLELAGYKSSYLHIGELVDHFFPPIKQVNTLNSYWNDDQLNQYINSTQLSIPPSSPGARSLNSGNDDVYQRIQVDEKYNDVNYWREPLPSLSDLSDEDDDGDIRLKSGEDPMSPRSPSSPKAPRSPTLRSIRSDDSYSSADPVVERPTSASSFTSPLKNFMMFGSNGNTASQVDDSAEYASSLYDQHQNPESSILTNESDYTDDDDDDYVDDDGDEDDYDYEEEDDYEDDDDYEEDGDGDDDLDLDAQDLDADLDADLKKKDQQNVNNSSGVESTEKRSSQDESASKTPREESPAFVKASQLLDDLSLN